MWRLNLGVAFPAPFLPVVLLEALTVIYVRVLYGMIRRGNNVVDDRAIGSLRVQGCIYSVSHLRRNVQLHVGRGIRAGRTRLPA